MTPFIVSLLVKVTLILALGLIATASLRNFGPSFRHQVLLVTLGSCLSLPALILLAPRWDVRVLPASVGTAPVTAAVAPVLPASDVRRSNPPSGADAISPVPGRARLDVGSRFGGQSRLAWLPIVWAIGFLAVLIWLVAGRIRLRRIAGASWPLGGADWDRVLREESREAGVSKSIRLLSSSVVTTPLTWGSHAPVILVPEDALDWSEAHRRVVLRHELAHVARGDALSQLFAGFVCALYWFHPLVWMAERRLRAECERACDDRVVSLGTPAAEYAAHLLEVARSARSFGAPGFLSVAMARPSQLEGRLLAVLNESGRHAAPSRATRAAALLISGLLLVTVSAFRAVPRNASSINEASSVTETSSVGEPNSGASLTIPRSEADVNTKAHALSEDPASPRQDSTFQRSAPARNGGTLSIDLRTGGHVKITGWDKPEAFLQAKLGGRDWRTTAVSFEAVDGGVRLESRDAGRSTSQSYSHTFDLNVPRNFNVRISSAGGGVSIEGVDGVFTGNTGGGEIEIRKANGEAEIRTGGGNIRVSDSRLTGSVSTGGGKVLIERVDGNFSGSSGSGPVTYINSNGGVKGKSGKQNIGISTGDGTGVTVRDGASVTISSKGMTTTYTNDGVGRSTFGYGGIRMNSNGGAISLPEAPDGARVTTGGGAIRIGPSAGEVYASTGGGPIDIGPASGSVEAHTGAGDVTITLTGAGSHSVDVTSGKGQVVLVLPRDLSATLEIETAYTNNLGHKTRIESELPLTITETNEWDSTTGTPRRYVRGRQIVGGGLGVIRVRTVNGNVILRRAH
jgi:beta-lactamase regulating signal transducer with metallopeptidase domain